MDPYNMQVPAVQLNYFSQTFHTNLNKIYNTNMKLVTYIYLLPYHLCVLSVMAVFLNYMKMNGSL